jgi:hypothetical protein
MAVKENNTVLATATTVKKDEVVTATLLSMDEKIIQNTNGINYRKCTLKTTTGATARGVVYEKVWANVAPGDEVRIALSTTPKGEIIPSVLGKPLAKLTLADFGL